MRKGMERVTVSQMRGKSKGKGHPRTGQEGLEGE